MIRYIFSFVLLFAAFQSYGQEVKHRLEAPVNAETPIGEAPSENHIWIPGQWKSNGFTYIWEDGYWTMPKLGHVYEQGKWSKNTRTRYWIWTPGHWVQESSSLKASFTGDTAKIETKSENKMSDVNSDDEKTAEKTGISFF